MPVASWKAFEEVLIAWSGSRLPDIVNGANIPLPGSRGRQVGASLAALGLVTPDGRTGMALERVVRRREGLVAALQRQWPELILLIEQEAPAEEVALAFAAIPGSRHSARRFRTFVLSACEREGLRVGPYRRLGAAAAPAETSGRSAGKRSPVPRLADGTRVAAGQLRRELALYEAALATAIEAGDVPRAQAWSAQLQQLRQELAAEHVT